MFDQNKSTNINTTKHTNELAAVCEWCGFDSSSFGNDAAFWACDDDVNEELRCRLDVDVCVWIVCGCLVVET